MVGESSMKSIKSNVIVTIIIFLFLITIQFTNVGSQDSNGELFIEKYLTEFSNGGEKLRLTATPDGEVVNIKLPSSATVLEGELELRGVLPQQITSYKVGKQPVYITGTDFNNDNNIDLVTANKYENTISVILNDGNGGFSSSMSYPVGDLPTYIYTGDLNKDNANDIACINKDSNSITVFFNVGDGTFEKSADYITADEPRSLIGADFDADNDIDLVTVNNNDNTLSIFFNNGDGTFQPRADRTTEYSPICGASGDLDGDGDVDLVIGNTGDNIVIGEKIYRSTVSIMLNKGDGTFKERVDYIVGKKPIEVVVADFDGDTDLDLATSNEAHRNISVLLNNGKGEFGAQKIYPITKQGIAAPSLFTTCDIDGDNDIDFVVAIPATDTVAVVFNNGDGTFPKFENYLMGYLPMAVFAGDFDGDKNIDLATVNRETNSVTVSINDGFGAFAKYSEYSVHGWPRGLYTADLDADSDLDIIVANYDGAITIWFNNGDGTYYGRIDYKLGVETFSVLAEDLDKDNDLDLIISIEFNFTIGVIFNNGDGTFDLANRHLYEIGGNPYALVAEDINNDGWPDIIASTAYQHAIFYSTNKGDGTFNNFTKYDMGEHYTFDLAAVDIDGDNDIDIIATNLGEEERPENTVSVILNRGDGTYSETYIDYIVDEGPIGVTTGDFNHDGRPDIATANRGTNSVSILFNLGNGTFGNEINYPAGREPYGIYSKDINQDGNIDILVPNHRGNSVFVLVNDGNGEFSNLNYEFLVGSGPTKLVVADVNDDQSEDALTVNLNTNTVSIHLMIYYPANIKVDIGNDNVVEWETNEYFTTSKTFKNSLVNELNEYLEKARNEGAEGEIEVPINVSADSMGIVEFSRLSLKYSMEPPKDETNGELNQSDEPDEFENIEVVGLILLVAVIIIIALIANAKYRNK